MTTRIFDKHGKVKRRDTLHTLLRDYGRAYAVNTVEIVAHGTGKATVVVAYADGSTGTAQDLSIADARQFCVGRNGFPHATIRAEIAA